MGIENHSAFFHMPGYLYMKDIEGKYTWCNQDWCKILNLEDYQQILGKTDYDFFSKEDADNFKKTDQQVIELETELTVQEALHLENNNVLNIFVFKRPLFSVTHKKVIGISCNAINISDFNCTGYLDQIINVIGGSIYWKDKMGFYLGCNEFAARKVGLKNSVEIIGKTDFDLFSAEQALVFRENDLYVMKYNKEIVEEEKVSSTEGDLLTQLSYKRPIYNKKGDIIGIIGNTIDITEKKKAEKLKREREAEKQKIAMEEREKFANLLEVLATSIAHEVRTPLNGIGFCVDNLQEIIPPSHQEALDYLTKIKAVIKSTSTMIKMILSTLKVSFSQKVDKRYFKRYSITHTIAESLSDYPFERR